MSKPYKILVGDTDTPQIRVPKTGAQSYHAPVTLAGSTEDESAFAIEVDVQQSDLAEYTALDLRVKETSIGGSLENTLFSVSMVDPFGGGLINSLRLSSSGKLIVGNSYLQTPDAFGLYALDSTTPYLAFDQSAGISYDRVGHELHIAVPEGLSLLCDPTGTDVFSGDLKIREGVLKIAGDSGPTWSSAAGTPEGNLAAPIGSMYTRTDGGAGTTLYVKESGSGNTGWVAK